MWKGTMEQFFEHYKVVSNHLKNEFPHLKIGGYSSCGFYCYSEVPKWIKAANSTDRFEYFIEFFLKFLEFITSEEGKSPLDFFSFHGYAVHPSKLLEYIENARNLCDQYGFTDTESILNEWNYVKGWLDEEWIYSLKSEKGLKGAAFTAAVMEMCQYEAVDMLMYYDARPGGMNGLFCTDCVFERLKGYYPFYMFNQLYKQDKAVEVVRDSEDVWAVAAKGEEQNVMLTYFNDDDNAPEKTVKVEFKNVENAAGVRLEYWCLDETHDCEPVREEIFTATEFAAYVKMPLNSTYLLKITKL
jgi:hypothetical protein